MCLVVVGTTMTAGVYGSRRLYGLAKVEKSGEEANFTGTFFAARQSASNVDEGVGGLGGFVVVEPHDPYWG